MDRRKSIAAVSASMGMLLLIFDSRCAVESGQQAIKLCINTVIPSLFPFIFLSGILTNTLWKTQGKILRIGAWILNIPTGGECLLLTGFLGGYPAGAISIGDAYHSGQMKRETAQRLLAYCSNAGPAFLFGMISSQFPEKWMVWSLWGIQLLSAAMVGTVISSPPDSTLITSQKDYSISKNMVHSIKTMGMICGWILLFRILIGFLDRWLIWLFPDWCRVFLWGLFELSNGCCALNQIENIVCRFIAASAMLSFGGICVAMQTSSAISGLSMKGYLTGKLLQMVFSIFLATAVCYGQGCIACILCGIFLIMPKIIKKSSSIPKLFDV